MRFDALRQSVRIFFLKFLHQLSIGISVKAHGHARFVHELADYGDKRIKPGIVGPDQGLKTLRGVGGDRHFIALRVESDENEKFLDFEIQ